ncbi:LLM class flavin-dependent oxidoreductase [Novosphingobium sp.]|uniref:LLM class flavin-dependent oxidoreductase n=1 Tax=Novosphingobium sp. TaxID=1874826 RepID=UPI0025D27A7E|nr:LLM class flavin-dependent oxidoreductase [Novosphingobium sp.]
MTPPETPIATTVSFDMRAPDWGTPATTLYGAALEMAAFADRIGVDRIGLMEHHGSDDGYLPQPFVLGAGMAAVTKRVRLLLGAVILPLHDPVKLAEAIAVLDLVSGGRLEVIFGAGYVRSEFDMFGVSLKDRGRLLDQGIDTILRALNGERFEAEGRPVFVRPLPVQKPEQIVLVGGGVEASARRAARFGVGFGPMRADLIPLYRDECRKLGREPGRFYSPSHGLPGIIMLSDDPDRTWAALEPHAFHVVSEYAKWAAQEPGTNSPFAGLTTLAALRQSGIFAVWTPDELIANAGKVADHGTFVFQPLVGGLAPEHGWRSLELLEACIPRLKAIRG